ncbi:MAG: hypothetical protein MJZ65_03675 [Paludibacteraceae bacterium]|nr:hypothetical protein [Paludibacteraceae bacterium]
MKKMYILAFFALFVVSAQMTVWATTYEYKCGPTAVAVEEAKVNNKYQYTFTITQNAKNTAEYTTRPTTTYATKAVVVVQRDTKVLEGTYSTNAEEEGIDGVIIANSTYVKYDTSTRYINPNQKSTFTISRNSSGKYFIGEGTLNVKSTDGTNWYAYQYCYEHAYLNTQNKPIVPFEFSKSLEYSNEPSSVSGGFYTMKSISNMSITSTDDNKFELNFEAIGGSSNYDYTFNLSLVKTTPTILRTFEKHASEFSSSSNVVRNTYTRNIIDGSLISITNAGDYTYKLTGKLYSVQGTQNYCNDFQNGVTFTYYNDCSFSEEDSVSVIASKKRLGLPMRTLTLNRSLSASNYNTFCSPVTIPAGEIETLLGAGAEVYEFAGTTNEGNNYTFTFSPLEGDIVAGVPYLVKPSSDNIEQIKLTNVPTSQLTTDAQIVTKDKVELHGILAPYTITELDPTLLFLADNNQLKWGAAGTMKGMRAYFRVNSNAVNISTRIQIEKRYPTDQPQQTADQTPCTNGKYIRDGRLIIMHNGKKYGMY